MADREPHAWQLGLVILGLFAAQAATLYHDAFFIKPAGDDFELVGEIRRGDRDGPLSLYTHSLANNFYRPSKSLTIWWSGRGREVGRAFRIRLAHFVLTTPYLAALALWLRFFRVPWLSALVAIVVFLVHPGLVATLSSIDGCGGMMASGLIWLGAWAIAAGKARPLLAISAASAAFVFGLTWKEYIFALVPLAAVTAFTFCDSRRVFSALRAGGVMFALFVVHLPLRRLVMPAASDASAGMLSHSPVQWVENLAIAGGGLLFFGDTVWLFLNRGLRVYGVAGTAVVAAASWVAIGLHFATQTRGSEGAETTPARRLPMLRTPTGLAICFLVAGLGMATFPAVLHHKHFAEKYLCPLLLPFAVLCAFAFEGWRKSRWRSLALPALALACVTSATADLRKNAELRAAGEFAERQALELLHLFEASAGSARVLVAYLRDEVENQPRYSIYKFSDDTYVMQPTPFYWWRPDSNLSIESVVVDSVSNIDVSRHAAVARWDAGARHFVRLK